MIAPANPAAYKNFGKAQESFSSAVETARQLGANTASDSDRLSKIAELRARQRQIQDSIVGLVKANDLEGARSLTNTPTKRRSKPSRLLADLSIGPEP